MSEHQKVFAANFKGKPVKMIIATVGVQIFDMKRRLVNTLLFTDMPKWTTGKTTRRDGSAAHCVRVFMSHETLGGSAQYPGCSQSHCRDDHCVTMIAAFEASTPAEQYWS